jgi:hypothetical protein
VRLCVPSYKDAHAGRSRSANPLVGRRTECVRVAVGEAMTVDRRAAACARSYTPCATSSASPRARQLEDSPSELGSTRDSPWSARDRGVRRPGCCDQRVTGTPASLAAYGIEGCDVTACHVRAHARGPDAGGTRHSPPGTPMACMHGRARSLETLGRSSRRPGPLSSCAGIFRTSRENKWDI